MPKFLDITIRNKERFVAAVERTKKESENLEVLLTNVTRIFEVVSKEDNMIYIVFFHNDDYRGRSVSSSCATHKYCKPCKHIVAAIALTNLVEAEKDLMSRHYERTQLLQKPADAIISTYRVESQGNFHTESFQSDFLISGDKT